MIEILIAAMAGTTAGLAFRAIRSGDPAIAARVQAMSRVVIPRSRGGSLKRIMNGIGERIPFDRDGVATVLRAAGLGSHSPESFMGARVATAMLGILIGTLTGGMAILAVPVLGIVGYQAPSLMVRRRIAARKEEILAELPDAVELLAICTRAGLNIPLALSRVAERSEGALGIELRKVQSEIDFGVSRRDALQSLGSRSGISRLDNLIRMLLNADRFGTRISTSLEGFASEIRGERRRRAEEQARKAPVKMLFPLVFLILPAFVLLTVVPLLLGTFQSLGF